jgi:hypothetical protein
MFQTQYLPNCPFTYEFVGDKRLGIVVYRDILTGIAPVPERLESALSGSSHPYFKWHESLVGEGVKMPEYRDCVDFKMDAPYIPGTPPEFSGVVSVYNDVSSRIKSALTHYQSMFNVNMTYMEAINFVRYTSGQHFNVHTDHGFSYICTVSNVTYLNEGGELWFPYLDVTIDPKAGDSVFFPSTYLFAHASKPVTSGTKYSAVTMFDYNDDCHKFGGFSRDFGQSYDQPNKP